MNPVYQPATVDKRRMEGDTQGIGFSVAPVIPLAGLLFKYTVWNEEDGQVIFTLTSPTDIEVVDQHVDINFLHVTTEGESGYFQHKCECFNEGWIYSQTLFVGHLSLNEGN